VMLPDVAILHMRADVLEKQRDELRAALENTIEKLELAAEIVDDGWEWLSGDIEAAQEAITKSEEVE
jgi:hypothetical protein